MVAMNAIDLRLSITFAAFFCGIGMGGLAVAQAAKPLPLVSTLQPALDEVRPTQALRDMLADLPAEFLTSEATTPDIMFGDLAAARRVIPAGHGPISFPILRAIPGGRFAGRVEFLDRWPVNAGFSVDDIAQVLTYDAPPIVATWVELTDQGAGNFERAFPAAGAASNGYTLETHDGVTAWAFGEDSSMNFGLRVRGDPFRGAMGRSSRLQLTGSRLRHASTWGVMVAITDETRADAAEEPGIAALLSALDSLDAGLLLQAMIIGDASAFGVPDPADTVMHGAVADGDGRWRSMILADFAEQGGWTAVMVSATTGLDAEAAAALAARVQANWAQDTIANPGRSFEDRSRGHLRDVSVIMGAEDMQVLRLLISGRDDAESRRPPINHGYWFFHESLMRRDIGYLE